MKIISYNVNGIRSAMNKNWLAWLQASNADVICLREIKATPEVIPAEIKMLEDMSYYHYWYPAVKKGYSGVAIFSKIKAKNGFFQKNYLRVATIKC
jgi:exodeoxyribonuclease-3